MQRIGVCAVIGVCVLAGNAMGGDVAAGTGAVSRQTHDRRLLADCMTKRMLTSRTMSYNEAAQVCKDQMKSRGDALSADNQVRPANGR